MVEPTPQFDYILASDIGGTNARLNLVKVQKDDHSKREIVKTFVKNPKDYPTYNALIKEFVEEFKNTEKYPKVMVAGVAGPNRGDYVEVTNIPEWGKHYPAKIMEEFGFEIMEIINDFEANGYGVLKMDSSDFFRITEAPVVEGAPKILIGAGTGLGEGFLTKSPNSDKYDVFPCEGGHTDFAARTQEEYDLMEFVKKKLNLERVSIERCCCGLAIPLIFEFLSEREPGKATVSFEDIPKDTNFEPNKNKKIIATGLKKECPICTRTVEMFASIYGAECGNYCLKTLPKGGLYLLSGITVALKDYIKNEKVFMDAFLSKGRMKGKLEEIPIFLITEEIGIKGAEEYAVRKLK